MRRAAPVLLLSLVTFAVSCSDDSNPTEPTPPARVSTEPAAATSATIGGDGGSVTATAGDGTVYTLEIPGGALPGPTHITMTPVRAIDGLPRLDGLVAGVVFRPGGLGFALPATLTIETTRTADAGEVPLALAFQGDAASFALAAAGEAGDDIVVAVSHFSGVAVGFGTESDRSALLASLSQTSTADARANELLALGNEQPGDASAMRLVLATWFDDAVLPAIQRAGDDGTLTAAIAGYHAWASVIPNLAGVQFDVATEFAARVDAARDAFVPALTSALQRGNAACNAERGLDAIRLIAFWQEQAELLGVANAETGLDASAVRSGACVTPDIAESAVPGSLIVNYDHDMGFRLVLRYGDGSTEMVRGAISITAENATIGEPVGETDETGWYATTITALGSAPVTVRVEATVILPGDAGPSLFARTIELEPSEGIDVTGIYQGFIFNDYAGKFELMTATVVQNPDGVHIEVDGAVHGCKIDAGFSLAADGTLALKNIIVAWDCPITGGFPVTGRIRGGGPDEGQFVIQYGTPTSGTIACEAACNEHTHCFAVIQGQMIDLLPPFSRVAGR